MTKIPDPKYGLLRCLGLAAAAVLMLSAAPAQRAEALSLINPGTVSTAKYASEPLVTEVRGRGGHGGGHHGFRGGGGRHFAFRGGGRRFGGFHRGGFRRGGVHFGGYRRHFGHRYYGGPVYYGSRCRIVVTYRGLRRVCGWRHHHRHHRWHRRWW
jgi:hypothetical protein